MSNDNEIPTKTYLYSIDSLLTEVTIEVDGKPLHSPINNYEESQFLLNDEDRVKYGLSTGFNPWKHLGVPDEVVYQKFQNRIKDEKIITNDNKNILITNNDDNNNINNNINNIDNDDDFNNFIIDDSLVVLDDDFNFSWDNTIIDTRVNNTLNNNDSIIINPIVNINNPSKKMKASNSTYDMDESFELSTSEKMFHNMW